MRRTFTEKLHTRACITELSFRLEESVRRAATAARGNKAQQAQGATWENRARWQRRAMLRLIDSL